MNANWKKTVEETIFDNKYVHIVKKHFILSDGEERDYSIVKGRNNVQVIALTEDSRVITIEQFRTGPEVVLLDIPGGGIDGDEKAVDAASRELFEETGYKGKEFIEISRNYNGPTREGITAIFLATGCYKDASPREEEKQLQDIKLLSLEEFERNLLNGNMMVSVVAAGFTVLKYLKY